MKTTHIFIIILSAGLVVSAFGQTAASNSGATAQTGPTAAEIKLMQQQAAQRRQLQMQADAKLKKVIDQANAQGVPTAIQTIAHYRGARDFQLSGIGLIVGLEGTGDSKKSTLTQTLYANYFKSHHLTVDSTTVNAQNVALVQVTAAMPAFTKPGTQIDVTVSSIADAKSLQGGTLILTDLYGPTNSDDVVATAQGPLSIGGFNVSAAGSSVQRNHVNVGRIPAGAEVQSRIDSQVVFGDTSDRVIFLDLDEPDPSTVARVQSAITEAYPELKPQAMDDTTVSLTLPQGSDPEAIMGKIGRITVYVQIPAKVVINERTGAIVVGGDVRLGPAMIVSGGLNVRIDTSNEVVQPAPFSQGTTAQQTNSSITATQEDAKIAIVPPLGTVSDLAKIFQALELKPNDVIQILQLLKQQGALKARIELQ